MKATKGSKFDLKYTLRVIGYIEHPSLKITVFETDGRFPVQFENGPYAQIYRFRKGGAVNSLNDVKTLVDKKMCEAVSSLLIEMKHTDQAAHQRLTEYIGKNLDDLPKII